MVSFPGAVTFNDPTDIERSAAMDALALALRGTYQEVELHALLADILDHIPGWKVYANRTVKRALSNKSALDVFNSKSLAYSNPAAELHVDLANGSDGGNGLTKATALKRIYAAEQALNALSGNGGIIHVYNTGHYGRSNNFYSSSLNVKPTVDTLYVAHDGIVDTSTCDSTFPTFTADATYPNTYSTTLTGVQSVFDMSDWSTINRGPTLMQVAASPALMGAGSGSICVSGGKLYIARKDGLAPTATNTRICRDVPNLLVQSDLNIGLIGATDKDGWSFMGGKAESSAGAADGYGGLCYAPPSASALPTDEKVLALQNITFAGGFHGLTVTNIHGLVFIDFAGETYTDSDGKNFHNPRGGTFDVVALNIWGRAAGRNGSISNQNLTQHDNNKCRALVVCPDFDGASGGLVRIVENSICQLVAPKLGVDRGDLGFSRSSSVGTVPPTAVRADTGAIAIVDDADIAPGNRYEFFTDGTGQILNRGRDYRGATGTW